MGGVSSVTGKKDECLLCRFLRTCPAAEDLPLHPRRDWEWDWQGQSGPLKLPHGAALTAGRLCLLAVCSC